MERKIGEIFEYNGEWYQCVKGSDCLTCDLLEGGYCINNHTLNASCFWHNREDGTKVIFKKLEKVGEPPCKSCYFGMVQLYKLPYWNNGMVEPVGCHFTGDGYVLIEIKQNKEDMEENNAKHSNSESIGRNLKPFDLEAARSGKPVCTRDGRKARIICFDAKGDKPIIALVEAKGNKDALIEKVERYFINGHSVFEVRETNNDLMMLPERKEGWVNVMEGTAGKVYVGNDIYRTEDEAKEGTSRFTSKLIASVPIEWEE